MGEAVIESKEMVERTAEAHIRGGRKLVNYAVRFLLPGMLALALGLPADAATLYRYINDKGYQEIGYSIPPHLAQNGYDVIDESGRLIRRVAAQLSEEEYAIKLEQERRLEACEKAMASVHRRYETLDDIDKAEEIFEAQLKERLQNLHANLEYGETSLKKLQDDAANLERAGKTIGRNLLDNIRETETQIRNLTAQIAASERSGEEKTEDFVEERRVFGLADCHTEQLAQAN